MQAPNPTGLDPLTSYLWDPLSHGVRYARISLKRSALKNFVAGIWQRVPVQIQSDLSEEEVRIGVGHTPYTLRDALDSEIYSLNDVTEIVRRVIGQRTIRYFVNTKELRPLAEYLTPALDWMCFANSLPFLISETFKRRSRRSGKHVLRPLNKPSAMLSRISRQKHGLFDSDLPFPSSEDALHVGATEHSDAFILEAASVRNDSLSRFLSFLSETHDINTGLQIITNSDQHSSRVVSELYAAAASAWIEGHSAVERVPRYMLEYLEAAIQYYGTKEWRTSIVLSAIALETLLAEMYEQEFHGQAPDIPLGALKDEIVKSFDRSARGRAFPDEILQWINRTNEVRVAAVHRGSRQLSGREALDALRGFVKAAIWYCYVR